MRESFVILALRASLERPALPTIPSSRTMLLDCRQTHGILWEASETFLERLPAQQGHLQDTVENSKNLASSSRGLKPEFTEHTMTPRLKMRPEQQGVHCSKTHSSQWRWNSSSYWWNLLSRWYDGLPWVYGLNCRLN